MAEALDPAVPDHVDALAKKVLQSACDRELKLVTAESCTGGLLASLLTDIPGQSHAFERGFVTYTNDAKHEMLGVPQDILDDPGPVSEAVARAMAEGALANSRGQVALSVTGVTDFDPAQDVPAGLVHFAVARSGAPTIHREERYGDIGRAEVRIRSLETALHLIGEAIEAPANQGGGGGSMERGGG